MKLVRKLSISAAAALFAVSLAGLSAPASAQDSSWGCGGECRGAP